MYKSRLNQHEFLALMAKNTKPGNKSGFVIKFLSHVIKIWFEAQMFRNPKRVFI